KITTAETLGNGGSQIEVRSAHGEAKVDGTERSSTAAGTGCGASRQVPFWARSGHVERSRAFQGGRSYAQVGHGGANVFSRGKSAVVWARCGSFVATPFGNVAYVVENDEAANVVSPARPM